MTEEEDRSGEAVESDQLPEEAPAEVAEDSTPEGGRDDARESPGAADESDPDQATGHPDNAG